MVFEMMVRMERWMVRRACAFEFACTCSCRVGAVYRGCSGRVNGNCGRRGMDGVPVLHLHLVGRLDWF